MKKLQISKLIIYSSIMFLTGSCFEKFDEKPNNQIDSIAWNQVADTGISVYSSSYNDGNLNLISGDKLLYNFQINRENNSVFNFVEFQTRPGWFKLPVSKEFLVTRTELDVILFAINSNSLSAPEKISPKDLDHTFVRFEDIPFWSGYDAFGLTEQGHVLVPYRTSVNGLAENNPSFLLISVSNNGSLIIINDVKIIKLNIVNYYDITSVVYASANFFYVKVGNNLVKIDHQGNATLETSIDGIKFVQLQNKIVGIGYRDSSKKIAILEADLDGSNIKVLNETPSSDNPTHLNFTEIDNRIVAFRDDKIYEFVDLSTNPTLRELNNSNLENVLISSMFLSKNGEIMITTQCRTLCGGLYSKPLDKFFDYKKIEE